MALNDPHVDSDEESSSSDLEEDGVNAKIQKLILEAEVNPFQYDKHVELITALRQSGDLDQLRTARENMANVYPLTEAMWLDWFHDELPLAMLQEQKEYLLEKFDLAVKDYTSVKVWHEYCQFVMNNIESPADIERARIVFERAITAVGLHVVEGSSIWDGYREFEMAILDSYQQLHESGDTIGMDAKVDMQIERISSLFKRQLSVPLMGMSETFKIFEDWLTEAIPSEVHRSYDRALQKLSLCMEYEEKLTSSVDSSFPSTNLPSLNEYLNYINYEMKDGDPARIQSIFERAIKDHCLQHELWIKYLNYLDYKLKIPDIALAAHVRSVRNCPWVSPLWVKYLNALERSNKDYSEIKDVFNQSLKGGFSGAPSYLQIWLADCDYHRRRAVDSSFDNEKVEDLRKSFEGAITYMNQYFGLEGDKNCILLREWAFIEAKYLNNAKRGQELWDTVMKKHSKDINMWLEYIHYLMLFADVPTIRRVFQRIIQISFDQPEQILEAFITFERQHGSLAELDDAQQKVDAQLIKIKEKREKEVFNPQPEKSVKKDQQKPNKKKKVKKEKSYLKRSNDESMEIESPLKRKKEEMKMESIDEVKTNKDDFTGVTVQTQAAFAKTEFTDIERSSSLPSPLNVNDKDQVVLNNGEQVRKVDNDASIFISNLLFSVDENHIKEKFEKFGEIETIRIVKNRAGKSKGYAYLQFKSKSSVDSSLLLDRESILGRPMFVSKCVDKQHNPTKFKFPTQLDKHTLYVSNLPFEMTAEEVTEHFAKIGKLKQVRLVTNRSGKSKGYAYVEYESEIDAQSAIVKLDQIPLHDRPINVALSNPPARKINVAHEDKFKVPSKEPGVRGRSKTQISMVPRSLQKSSSSEVSNNSSTLQELKGNDATIKDKGPAVAMNNEEFRQFLLKH